MTQRVIIPSRIVRPPAILARGIKHTMQTRIARDRAREQYEADQLAAFIESLEGGG